MKTIKSLLSIPFIILALSLTGCGGGGGGGGDGGDGGGIFSLDGEPISASGSSSSSSPALYTFNVVAGNAYSIAMVKTLGDTAIFAFDYDPSSVVDPAPIGTSWHVDAKYEAISFIASATGTIYVHAQSMGINTSYTIEATTNNLSVGTAATTDSVYGGGMLGSDLFYSFEAQAGLTYEVRVTPTEGDVDLLDVTPNADMTGTVGGSSIYDGLTPDSVYFTAAATQRYYIRAVGTDVDSTFGIKVLEVPANPDVRVTVDSAVSDGTDVTVNYTVYNGGVSDYNGNLQVDVWADSASAPGVGLTGDFSMTHSAVTLVALGTLSGSATIANAAENGTAYAVVDTIEAVVEVNESNNVSAAKSWIKPLFAPVSFDFEDGTIPIKSVMSGDANWQIDSATGGNGSSTSLRSGNIGDSQNSCIALNAYNAVNTVISFDRKVSSELNKDFLRFYIDGVMQNEWSGTIVWGNVSYTTTTSGLHEYKWCYTKDAMLDGGTDEAWIDNIIIESASFGGF